MFVVTVTFDIAPDRVTAFMDAMRVNALASFENEAGCWRFDVCVDPEAPTRVFLYELYDDRAAFDDHLASDHFKTFDDEVQPMLRAKHVETWTIDTTAA